MQYSHSRVGAFEKCPFKYKMQYVDRITALPDDDPTNALILGHAMHTGIEKGVQAGINEYYMSYPIISDKHINEAIKLEYFIPKVRELLEPGGTFEMSIMGGDFIGYLDYVTKNDDDTYNIFDFKYSNNIDTYVNSSQLHLYKYFFEKYKGKRVKHIAYIFIPKVGIRQKETESLYEFRTRLRQELEESTVTVSYIDYDISKVIDWLLSIKKIQEATEFNKEPSYLCKYCEYEGYCQKGNDYMLIPKHYEPSGPTKTKKHKIWIYGAPFSGKTTMLDDAPAPLNLNTDGNTEQMSRMVTIPIKDVIKVEGRRTVRTFAWEIFKDAISELEKKDNDFKTIVVDLLEDTREMCRLYMYDRLNIQHESDSGYGKGWDIIKTEYLSTIRRLFNLDYENIVVVSHEDISKDITKKNGQNITRIAPNIQESLANKIAGMVDIVARVVVEDDETRTLNFKSNEVIFGGGRLKGIKSTTIPLKWDALMAVYDDVNGGKKADITPAHEDTSDAENKPVRGRKHCTEETADEPTEVPAAEPMVEQPEAVSETEEVSEPEMTEEPVPVEKPVRRTRRRRVE